MNPLEKIISRIKNQKDGEIIEFEGIRLISSKNVFSPKLTNCTKLFSDAIKAHENAKCLEIGIGSGINLISLSKKISNLRLYGGDINPHAIDLAASNFKLNGVEGDLRKSDLFSAFENEKFDYIYFNPPLTWKEYEQELIVEASIFDPNGKVVKSFLDTVSNYLNPNGKIFILYTRKHRSQFEACLNKNSLRYKVVSSKDVGYEKYSVYQIEIKH